MRFSLRTLLVVTTGLAVWLGYLTEQAHRQRVVAQAIDRLHGQVRYDDSLSDSPLRRWLAGRLGRERVASIEAVYLGGTSAGDDDLALLKRLLRLRTVVLTSTAVTDAGLVHLRGLTSLETIDLRFTAVTEAGVADLRRVLPQAKILSKSDIE
ncbi:MAG TPA: hypothetical protein VG125_00935 [Pirellulales bacterium]|jgi:hypothetical protein|nr:hypothetical protein [Pirellulales bacterium]